MYRGVSDELGLRPLSARSVVLSLLLGAHPAQLPVRDLVRAAEILGISDQTLRVSLTRMVAAGDLLRADATYRLSDRLLERQRRQDDAIHPATRPWRGAWELVVITAIGRAATDRAELRAELGRLRLAELREGCWVRPANLHREWPAHLDQYVQRFTGRPDSPADELVRTLWNLPGWAHRSNALLSHFDEVTDPAARITTAAAIVRHLREDPVLPDALLPADWPGASLRSSYATYQAEVAHIVSRETRAVASR